MDAKVRNYTLTTVLIVIIGCAISLFVNNGISFLPLIAVIVGYPCVAMGLYMLLEQSGWRWVNGVDWTAMTETEKKNLISHWGLFMVVGSIMLIIALSIILSDMVTALVMLAIGVILMVYPVAKVDTYKSRPAIEFGKHKFTAFIIISLIAIAPTLLVDSSAYNEAVSVTFDEDTFAVKAPMVDLVIPYDMVSDLGYDEHFDKGSRTWGYGTPTISSGTFNNVQFGNYTLASYTQVEPCVFFTVVDDGKVKYFAFNQSTAEDTEKAYEALKALLP